VSNLFKFFHLCWLTCVSACIYRAVVSAVGLSVLRNALELLFLLYRFITGCVLRTNNDDDDDIYWKLTDEQYRKLTRANKTVKNKKVDFQQQHNNEQFRDQSSKASSKT